MFTDSHGNIINDDNTPIEDRNSEITGVDTYSNSNNANEMYSSSNTSDNSNNANGTYSNGNNTSNNNSPNDDVNTPNDNDNMDEWDHGDITGVGDANLEAMTEGQWCRKTIKNKKTNKRH